MELNSYSSLIKQHLDGLLTYHDISYEFLTDIDGEKFLCKCVTNEGSIFFAIGYYNNIKINIDDIKNIKSKVIGLNSEDISIARNCFTSRGYEVDGIVTISENSSLSLFSKSIQPMTLRLLNVKEAKLNEGIFPFYLLDNINQDIIMLCNRVCYQINNNIYNTSLTAINDKLKVIDQFHENLLEYSENSKECMDELQKSINLLIEYTEEYQNINDTSTEIKENKKITLKNLLDKKMQIYEIMLSFHKIDLELSNIVSINSMVKELNEKILIIKDYAEIRT